MTNRSGFSDLDWETLQFAPLWMFTMIAGVDGDIDKKELKALADELTDAPFYKEPLVREVFMSVVTEFSTVWERFKADSRDVMQGLMDTARVLDGNCTRDTAEHFKRALLLVGRKVGEASGGIIKGKVSDKEKAALVLAAATLNVSFNV